MPRPKLPINTTGEIRAREESPGKWVAIADHRDPDGRKRQYERSGRSRSAAIRELKKHLANPHRVYGIKRDRITGATTMTVLAGEHFTRLEGAVARGECSPNTLALYRGTWSLHGAPKLGALTLAEADVQALDRFLIALRDGHGPSVARTLRAVLSGMLGLATRYKAIPANPVRDVTRIRSNPSSVVRALEPAEAVDLWRKLLELSRTPAETSANRRRYTPTVIHVDLPDIVLFMLGTSLRIGQALGVHWPDVDLDTATATVGRNVIRVKGQGLRLNEGTTKSLVQVMDLPGQVVVMLRNRREGSRYSPLGPVFPGDEHGNLRDPSNTLGDLRRAVHLVGYGWVTSHTFRRTVATVLDDAGLSAREIADQLTHSRPSMTQDRYMARKGRNPRALAVINRMLAMDPDRKVISLSQYEHPE